MTEEYHPLGEYLNANGQVLDAAFLFSHPDAKGDDPVQMELFLCELLDIGLQEVWREIDQLIHAEGDDDADDL